MTPSINKQLRSLPVYAGFIALCAVVGGLAIFFFLSHAAGFIAGAALLAISYVYYAEKRHALEAAKCRMLETHILQRAQLTSIQEQFERLTPILRRYYTPMETIKIMGKFEKGYQACLKYFMPPKHEILASSPARRDIAHLQLLLDDVRNQLKELEQRQTSNLLFSPPPARPVLKLVSSRR